MTVENHEELTSDQEFAVQDFNNAWIQWFKNMAVQMPEISDPLNSAIGLAEDVTIGKFYALMENFAYYTQAHLHELIAGDEKFLERMVAKAAQSKYKLMPTEFMDQYRKSTPTVKFSIFETLKAFAMITAQVRDDYRADFQRAETDVTGK